MNFPTNTVHPFSKKYNITSTPPILHASNPGPRYRQGTRPGRHDDLRDRLGAQDRRWRDHNRVGRERDAGRYPARAPDGKPALPVPAEVRGAVSP